MCKKQANVSWQRRNISGYPALIFAISSVLILLLSSGAHQFGVRWNTVSWPSGLGYFLDRLDSGGAGADHRHSLARCQWRREIPQKIVGQKFPISF